MKPGRELDALVAEKVMGLNIPTGADTQYLETCMDLPYYSTDIAAAWDVVEELSSLEFLWVSVAKDDLRYICQVQKFNPPIERIFTCSQADTAPHAICLAALKAARVKIE